MKDPVEYIYSFSRLGSRVRGLGRISSLLEALGRPQDSLRFIHIAGTNGKGSIAQMLSEVLTAQGYRTGLFTSPYIITFFDRIRLNNENIPESELAEVLEEIAPIIEAHPMRGDFSQFEVTQAAAYVWYKKQKCDAVIVEAGIGGLLDSTNIIEAPLVSVVGSIGLDHTAILGGTIEEIAFQKAGIIKEGCPCVLSAGNPPEAVRVFREQAAEKAALLNIPNLALCRVDRSDIFGSSFTYRGERYETSMPGLHQVSNAITVIDALRLISDRLPVSAESIRLGIKRAKLPGRLEIVSKNPLTILDGAHNPNAMAALAGFLSTLKGRTVRAVIGMHEDKDAGEAVRQLVPYVSCFYPVSGFSDRDIPAERLDTIIKEAGGRSEISEQGIFQLADELSRSFPEDVLIITGSLYLVSYFKMR